MEWGRASGANKSPSCPDTQKYHPIQVYAITFGLKNCLKKHFFDKGLKRETTIKLIL
jgi:hypothetical protein